MATRTRTLFVGLDGEEFLVIRPDGEESRLCRSIKSELHARCAGVSIEFVQPYGRRDHPYRLLPGCPSVWLALKRRPVLNSSATDSRKRPRSTPAASEDLATTRELLRKVRTHRYLPPETESPDSSTVSGEAADDVQTGASRAWARSQLVPSNTPVWLLSVGLYTPGRPPDPPLAPGANLGILELEMEGGADTLTILTLDVTFNDDIAQSTVNEATMTWMVRHLRQLAGVSDAKDENAAAKEDKEAAQQPMIPSCDLRSLFFCGARPAVDTSPASATGGSRQRLGPRIDFNQPPHPLPFTLPTPSTRRYPGPFVDVDIHNVPLPPVDSPVPSAVTAMSDDLSPPPSEQMPFGTSLREPRRPPRGEIEGEEGEGAGESEIPEGEGDVGDAEEKLGDTLLPRPRSAYPRAPGMPSWRRGYETPTTKAPSLFVGDLTLDSQRSSRMSTHTPGEAATGAVPTGPNARQESLPCHLIYLSCCVGLAGPVDHARLIEGSGRRRRRDGDRYEWKISDSHSPVSRNGDRMANIEDLTSPIPIEGAMGPWSPGPWSPVGRPRKAPPLTESSGYMSWKGARREADEQMSPLSPSMEQRIPSIATLTVEVAVKSDWENESELQGGNLSGSMPSTPR